MEINDMLYCNGTMITNFHNKDLHIYEKSVKLYNKVKNSRVLYISNKAYSQDGERQPMSCSLHSEDKKDKREFWNYHYACRAFNSVYDNRCKEFTKEIADKLIDALELTKGK